jgi:hypothetical protein
MKKLLLTDIKELDPLFVIGMCLITFGLSAYVTQFIMYKFLGF